MKLCVTRPFIYKQRDTSQKTRQFLLHFCVHKSGHVALRNISRNFWNLRSERVYLYAKNNARSVTFLFTKKKKIVRFLHTKNLTLCVRYL